MCSTIQIMLNKRTKKNIIKELYKIIKYLSLHNLQQDSDIRNILEAFQSVITTKRILLKQPFQDFDQTNSSRISITQVKN